MCPHILTVFPYALQPLIFDFCLIEDLYKFTRTPICKICAKRRYSRYGWIEGRMSFLNFHKLYYEPDFIRVLPDFVVCKFTLYGKVPVHTDYWSYSSFPIYARHCIISTKTEYRIHIRHEMVTGTIIRLIRSPLLTWKVACAIGQELILSQSMSKFTFLLQHRRDLLFPDDEVGNKSFWELVEATPDPQTILVILKIYNPSLRYLRCIICYLLESRMNEGLDFILNWFTPLSCPMFFKDNDPLKAALIYHPEYVPILLKYGLFHAYRDYSSMTDRRDIIAYIVEEQHRIKLLARSGEPN